MSERTPFVGRLPEGIAGVFNEDQPMVGDMLIIKLESGHTVVIDALHLGDHLCQVGVYGPGVWEGETLRQDPLATICFNPEMPTEVNCYDPQADRV